MAFGKKKQPPPPPRPLCKKPPHFPPSCGCPAG